MGNHVGKTRKRWVGLGRFVFKLRIFVFSKREPPKTSAGLSAVFPLDRLRFEDKSMSPRSDSFSTSQDTLQLKKTQSGWYQGVLTKLSRIFRFHQKRYLIAVQRHHDSLRMRLIIPTPHKSFRRRTGVSEWEVVGKSPVVLSQPPSSVSKSQGEGRYAVILKLLTLSSYIFPINWAVWKVPR